MKHANECHIDSTQYSYYNDEERVELVFNCVYKVIAVKFHGQTYLSIDALDLHQKAGHMIFLFLLGLDFIHSSSTLTTTVVCFTFMI